MNAIRVLRFLLSMQVVLAVTLAASSALSSLPNKSSTSSDIAVVQSVTLEDLIAKQILFQNLLQDSKFDLLANRYLTYSPSDVAEAILKSQTNVEFLKKIKTSLGSPTIRVAVSGKASSLDDRGSSLLIITHAEQWYDRSLAARDGINEVADRFLSEPSSAILRLITPEPNLIDRLTLNSAFKSNVLALDPTPQFLLNAIYYTDVRQTHFLQRSSHGEFLGPLSASNITLVGGFAGDCLSRTFLYALYRHNNSDPLSVHFPMKAIYLENGSSTITLANRARDLQIADARGLASHSIDDELARLFLPSDELTRILNLPKFNTAPYTFEIYLNGVLKKKEGTGARLVRLLFD